MSDQFIPLPEVQKATGGKSRSTIYRWVKVGILPAPRRIGPNSIGWLQSEIDSWVENLRKAGSQA